ncbi:hypothetical protein ACFC1L_35005 [Streptomyces sp. NPDC056210]|uniref:hypothetical protein n=1 Tax=Streptomyces sp. NPDC056210 TaxID=3345746 RepID=UPI0035DF266B
MNSQQRSVTDLGDQRQVAVRTDMSDARQEPPTLLHLGSRPRPDDHRGGTGSRSPLQLTLVTALTQPCCGCCVQQTAPLIVEGNPEGPQHTP